MKAYSPTGNLIVGTLELIEGVAQILPDSFEKGKAVRLEFEYEGETEIDWNSQKTKLDAKKHRLFVDDKHEIWSENELVLKD